MLSSRGAAQTDVDFKNTVRKKIRHNRQYYVIVVIPVAVNISGRVYDDFFRLIFLHAHREASVLTGELPEESDQFRFLSAVFFANLKGSKGLMLTKPSAMRVTIPIDLSVWSFIRLPRFFRSRRVPPLLTTPLVLFPQNSVKGTHDVCSVLT